MNPILEDRWSTPDYLNVQGLGTFDLTNLTWQSGYKASGEKYLRSQLVQSCYSTDGIYPRNWNSPDLRDLFVRDITNTSAPTPSDFSGPSSASGLVPTSPTETGHGNSSHSKFNMPAAAAGASIGAAILISILVGLLYYIHRYHWRERRSSNERELESHVRHELPLGCKRDKRARRPPPSPVELAAGEVVVEKDAMTPLPPVYKSPTGHLQPASQALMKRV